MSTLFDTGTPLVVLFGLLAAPLLVRQHHFSAFQRSWAILPACALAMLPAVFFPLEHTGDLLLALRLSCALLATLPGLLLLKLLLGGADREQLELFVALPGLLWLPLLARPLLAPVIDLPAGPLGRASALGLMLLLVLALVFVLTGAQERFRLNRAPGSIEGLPFRLGSLLLLLVLLMTLNHLRSGGGLG
ncbi:MAG: hypothetical protein KDC10_07115 [Calditrichaeota bacterium]|nr:hypothetical protein [Calditrichota bacterium]MCB9475184.1 hypothetical protein [Candidatus Delongbacteria bacterium]